jgi:hypothetical protein
MREYGDEAGLIAAKRADALLALGDLDGFNLWKRVVDAISELHRTTPIEAERLT